jgi:hypothetical protein
MQEFNEGVYDPHLVQAFLMSQDFQIDVIKRAIRLVHLAERTPNASPIVERESEHSSNFLKESAEFRFRILKGTKSAEI